MTDIVPHRIDQDKRNGDRLYYIQDIRVGYLGDFPKPDSKLSREDE